MYPNLSLPLQMTCTYRARYAPTGPPRLTAAGSPDTPDLLYFATEDPLCYYKAFQYVSIQDDELGPGLRGAFIHVPEAAASCHSYSTPYATVLAPLRGDWFDAAMRYRAWAVRQPWCSRGPLRTRADQPDWIKAVPVWYLASDLGDEHVKALSDNADFLGLPIAAHWYDWHHNPFDSRVPDYFPPRRGDGQFHRDIAEWRRRGIFPVPYIQGLGWDLLGESYAAEGAAAGVCLAEDGTPPYTVYCKGTPDECHMASMCLASSFWQDKLAAIVGKLADYGVAGVYLDSIGCGAQACYAPDHGHPPGPGGHYWSDAVRELLARLHRIEDPDGERLVFTTEGFTECGLDSFDAYLPHLHHPRPDEPCVYDAVYHDYTSFHGCFTGWRYAPDGTLSRAAATCFALGRPLGWFYHGFHNDAYLTPEARPEMDFLRELAHARVALADFLALGAMLPPPSVIEEGDDPRGSVLASAWRAGDEVLVVAVNHADEAVSFRVGLERLGPGATLEPFWPRDDPQPGVLSTGGLSGALRLGPRALRAWRGPARAAR